MAHGDDYVVDSDMGLGMAGQQGAGFRIEIEGAAA